MDMAIAAVKQDGNCVYIYNETGMQTGVVFISSNATLMRYTATSVSVKDGNITYIYDETGMQTGVVY